MRRRIVPAPAVSFIRSPAAMKPVLCLALSVLLFAPVAYAQQVAAPTAQQIPERTATVYQSCDIEDLRESKDRWRNRGLRDRDDHIL